MNDETRIRLVGKLLKMTIDGSLRWDFHSDPDVLGQEDELLSERYAASIGGLSFQVYQVRKRWPDDFTKLLRQRGIRAPVSGLGWETRTVLDIIDPDADHQTVATMVDIEARGQFVRSLFDAARRSITRADDKISNFIKDELPAVSGPVP